LITLEQKLLLLRRSGVLQFYTAEELQPAMDKLTQQIEDFTDEKIVEMLGQLPKPKKKIK
jgi:hypothetical protein